VASSTIPGGAGQRPSARRAIIGTAVVTAIALAIGWSIVSFASSNPDKVNLGDDVFVAGSADSLREEIADGGPVLYPDLLGRGRPIFIQTVGDDWRAFEAVAPGASEQCALSWVSSAGNFQEPKACGGLTFPADGDGLVQYRAVERADGKVEVDLRSPL
jgi:hypothetical protein